MEQEIMQLENQVRVLKEWKDSRIKERLSFPLDVQSRKLLNSGALIATRNPVPNLSLIGGSDLLLVALGITVNGEQRFVRALFPLEEFTADALTDVITNSGGSHNLVNGDIIALASTGTLPAGLNDATPYYIINATGTTFKVSLTLGGSAVNITDLGTGTHYYGKIS